jgi:hypothetical protein
MPKMHIKGMILRIIKDSSSGIAEKGIWDYDIAKQVLSEYNLDGAYAMGSVRVALTDLYSGALIETIEEKLDNGEHFGNGKLLFKYSITSFGEERMKDTGILG